MTPVRSIYDAGAADAGKVLKTVAGVTGAISGIAAAIPVAGPIIAGIGGAISGVLGLLGNLFAKPSPREKWPEAYGVLDALLEQGYIDQSVYNWVEQKGMDWGTGRLGDPDWPWTTPAGNPTFPLYARLKRVADGDLAPQFAALELQWASEGQDWGKLEQAVMGMQHIGEQIADLVTIPGLYPEPYRLLGGFALQYPGHLGQNMDAIWEALDQYPEVKGYYHKSKDRYEPHLGIQRFLDQLDMEPEDLGLTFDPDTGEMLSATQLAVAAKGETRMPTAGGTPGTFDIAVNPELAYGQQAAYQAQQAEQNAQAWKSHQQALTAILDAAAANKGPTREEIRFAIEQELDAFRHSINPSVADVEAVAARTGPLLARLSPQERNTVLSILPNPEARDYLREIANQLQLSKMQDTINVQDQLIDAVFNPAETLVIDYARDTVKLVTANAIWIRAALDVLKPERYLQLISGWTAAQTQLIENIVNWQNEALYRSGSGFPVPYLDATYKTLPLLVQLRIQSGEDLDKLGSLVLMFWNKALEINRRLNAVVVTPAADVA